MNTPLAEQAPSGRGLLPGLQVLRFAAASMVLLHHLERELAGPVLSRPLADPTGVEWSTGVDVFFIVSGFIMTLIAWRGFGQPAASRTFLGRRMMRVVPLYWLFTALTILSIVLFSKEVVHNDLNPGRILTSFLFLPWFRAGGDLYPILGLGWTLNYEVLFYLAFALALWLPRAAGLAALAFGFLAAAILNGFIAASWAVLRFWTDPIILEFIFGVGLCLLYKRGVRLSGPVRAALFVAGLAGSILATRMGWVDHIGRELWGGVPAILIASSLALDGQIGPPKTRVMAWLVLLGDASYALYLSHMFAIRGLTLVWLKLKLGSPLLYAGVGFVLATALAVALHLWVERPLLAWLRGMTRRPKAEDAASGSSLQDAPERA